MLGAAVRHAVRRNFDDVADEVLSEVAETTLRGFNHLLKNQGKAVRACR